MLELDIGVTQDELFRGLGGDSLDLLTFPDWEVLPYDLFSPHPDITSDRLRALYELPQTRERIVGNLHRAYLELDPTQPLGAPLDLAVLLDLGTGHRRVRSLVQRGVLVPVPLGDRHDQLLADVAREIEVDVRDRIELAVEETAE